MRARALIAVTIGLVGLVGCGGGDDDNASDDTAAAETTAAAEATTAPETTAAAETTAAPETTAAADPAAVETTVAAETTPAAGGGTVDVTLVEWAVEAPTEIPAGTVTFNVTNGGEFPHELVVVRGESYETLPQDSSGAVDDTQLPAGDFIGETARLDGGGGSEALTVDLPAGNYVLLCNITGGGSSHAARGQVLSVTVA